MLKTRKKSISLIVTLAFLLTVIIPAGAAFAASPVKVSYATKYNVPENEETDLGWIQFKIDEDETITGWVYATINLPDDVKFKNDGNDIKGMEAGADSDLPGFLVGAAKKDKVTFAVYMEEEKEFNVVFNFSGGTQVIVDEDAADEIYVTYELNVKDIQGNTISGFATKGEALVGDKTAGEVTVTADTPTTIKVGTNKAIADITISESMAGTIEDEATFTFTLPDGFAWEEPDNDGDDDWVEDGSYLTGEVEKTANDTVVLHVYGGPSTFEDELVLKAKIRVFPDAPEGDVTVDVEGSSDPDSGLDEVVTLTVATIGLSDVTISTDDDKATDDMWQALDNVQLYDITLESSGTFGNGDDIILTLPDGFKFTSAMDDADFGNDFNNYGRYDSDKSLWLAINGAGKDEVTISGLEVKILADAEPGDIVLQISGDVTEDTVVVGVVKSKITVDAEKPQVTVGLERAAGDITITETEKDSLSTNKYVYLELPSGVTFASVPTVEVNGDEVDDVSLFDSDQKCKFMLEGLSSAKIDTIVVSDVKYDIDSLRWYGDIVVDIGGPALNELAGDDADDPVASAANATIVSPTAAEAVMTIGDTTMVVNGEEVEMDVVPYIKDGRTMLPVRFAANAVGVSDDNILWDGVNRKVTILKGDRVIQFTIDSNVMLLNGAAITMDVAPEILAGRTMLPVRYIAQALGADIDWDPDTQTVTIKVE